MGWAERRGWVGWMRKSWNYELQAQDSTNSDILVVIQDNLPLDVSVSAVYLLGAHPADLQQAWLVVCSFVLTAIAVSKCLRHRSPLVGDLLHIFTLWFSPSGLGHPPPPRPGTHKIACLPGSPSRVLSWKGLRHAGWREGDARDTLSFLPGEALKGRADSMYWLRWKSRSQFLSQTQIRKRQQNRMKLSCRPAVADWVPTPAGAFWEDWWRTVYSLCLRFHLLRKGTMFHEENGCGNLTQEHLLRAYCCI